MPFELRFPKDDIAGWAKRYCYRDGDRTVAEIGVRSQQQEFYTREDFLAVCKWKTRGRPRRHYETNSEEDTRQKTHLALTTPHEERRITSLIGAFGGLHGVSWPTASVLLHFAHRDLYPILDYRALWSLSCEPKVNTFGFWWEYVHACRIIASDCRISMRQLDRALWQYSKENQPKRSTKK